MRALISGSYDDVTLRRTIIQDKDFGQYIDIGFVLVLQEVSFLLLLISYFLCHIEFIFLLNLNDNP